VTSYVTERQKEGISASTIKTELSAIRYYHDQFPGVRYRLTENKDLNLENEHLEGLIVPVRNKNIHRWSSSYQMGRHDIANMMKE
jgi:TATA-box binding protein (TBP) (component of TFIID and TFIIIB)